MISSLLTNIHNNQKYTLLIIINYLIDIKKFKSNYKIQTLLCNLCWFYTVKQTSRYNH